MMANSGKNLRPNFEPPTADRLSVHDPGVRGSERIRDNMLGVIAYCVNKQRNTGVSKLWTLDLTVRSILVQFTQLYETCGAWK